MNKNDVLRWASNNGHTEIVKLLLEAGADVHSGDDWALKWASKNGHVEVVKVLLNNAYDDNNHSIRWAFRYASENSHKEVVKLLEKHRREIEWKSFY